MSDVDQPPPEVLEAHELLNYFYGFSRTNDPDRYIQASSFRTDAYRLIVLQMQLAIEELVRSFVFEKLTTPPDPGTFTYEEDVQYVQNLNGRHLLELAGRLHILSDVGYSALIELNQIRNKCVHNWGLHSYSTKERIKAFERGEEIPPRIDFEGGNLLDPFVMKEHFLAKYGDLYVELFAIHYGIDVQHTYTDESLQEVRRLSP